MKEIRLTKSNRVQVLQQALEVLSTGGVIVYPTETSYGLGCDFYDQNARNKIYRIKKRSKDKPLPVIIPDIIAASYLVNFSDEARRLALEYWPGALTLVLPFKYCQWQGHCDDHLAVRVSSHPFASDLVSNFGKPIVATSANTSDQPPCYSPTEVNRQFKGASSGPDLFINAGTLPKNPSSTIIKFDGKPEILRQGNLKIKL